MSVSGESLVMTNITRWPSWGLQSVLTSHHVPITGHTPGITPATLTTEWGGGRWPSWSASMSCVSVNNDGLMMIIVMIVMMIVMMLQMLRRWALIKAGSTVEKDGASRLSAEFMPILSPEWVDSTNMTGYFPCECLNIFCYELGRKLTSTRPQDPNPQDPNTRVIGNRNIQTPYQIIRDGGQQDEQYSYMIKEKVINHW